MVHDIMQARIGLSIACRFFFRKDRSPWDMPDGSGGRLGIRDLQVFQAGPASRTAKLIYIYIYIYIHIYIHTCVIHMYIIYYILHIIYYTL